VLRIASCHGRPRLMFDANQLFLVLLEELARYLNSAPSSHGIGHSFLLTAVCQPLSLLLKASPYVDELALYDVVNTPGVAADLSHIASLAVQSPPNLRD
jgi:hypothetical protein